MKLLCAITDFQSFDANRAIRRLEQMEEISPNCAWPLSEYQCGFKEQESRRIYRQLLDVQLAYESRIGV